MTRPAALVTFLALSGLGFYTVMYHIVASGGNEVIIKTMCPQPPTYKGPPQLRYTGFTIPDAIFCHLVPFFHAGFVPQNFQFTLHFLAGVAPVALAYIIEGSRTDSASSVRPLLVGIAYQFASAAGTIPLGWLALVLSSAGRSDRARKPLTRAQAEAAFIGVMVGCVVPTAAMLLLQDEYVTAYWQIFPVYVWIVQHLWLAIRRGNSAPEPGLSVVRAALLTVAAISALPHLRLLYHNRSPSAFIKWWPSFSVPDSATTTLYTAAAHLLKWDAIVWYTSSIVAAAFLVDSPSEAFAMLAQAPALSAIIGPGAVVALLG
ncbi:hypothetical protein AURDEDRAFT_114913 [Auricularia subglabra TFB-10046 SS5]|nr:hypothetical protein AURDEDRAFT_114913 [Auricularia subglabra TFB-10046 SS5]